MFVLIKCEEEGVSLHPSVLPCCDPLYTLVIIKMIMNYVRDGKSCSALVVNELVFEE